VAESLGVDALGFVFVRKSARFIEPEQAAEILAALPPFATPVGLFLDSDDDQIERAFAAIPNLVPQFHGQESAADCERWGRGYLKAIGLGGSAGDPGHVQAQIDSHVKAMAFRPLILAGGLSAANVGQAIVEVQPWAVDVSSGVESAKGIKEAQKMAAFVQAVQQADSA